MTELEPAESPSTALVPAIPIGDFKGTDLVPRLQVGMRKDAPKSLYNTDAEDFVFPKLILLQGQSPAVTNGVEGARPGSFILIPGDRIIRPPFRALLAHHHKSRYFKPNPENERHRGLEQCISLDAITGTRYGACSQCKLAEWHTSPEGKPLKPLCPLGQNFGLLIEDDGPLPVIMRVNLSNKTNKNTVKNILSTMLFRGFEMWERMVIVDSKPEVKVLANGQQSTYYTMLMRFVVSVPIPQPYLDAGESTFEKIRATYNAGKLTPEQDDDLQEPEDDPPPF